MKTLRVWMIAMALTGPAGHAQAGIPVIDGANLAQAIQEVIAWAKQYEQMVTTISNQVEQIQHLASTYQSMTGNRALGTIANLIGPYDIVSPDVIDGMRQAQRAVDVVERTRGMLQNSSLTNVQRARQIAQLLQSINLATDPKGGQEIIARINAEVAATVNDQVRISIADMNMRAEAERIQNEIRARQAAIINASGRLNVDIRNLFNTDR